MRLAVDRHLALLHGLEQRGLRLGAGAVDLVREEDLRKHRTRPELEGVFLLVEGAHAGDIRREEVRSEPDAAECAVERAGERLSDAGLSEPRHALIYKG